MLDCLHILTDHINFTQVSVKVTADMDLADHLLSFLNAALSSPEAQHALPLRKAFVLVLLDLGEKLPLVCIWLPVVFALLWLLVGVWLSLKCPACVVTCKGQ